jgi:hypothetical protein
VAQIAQLLDLQHWAAVAAETILLESAEDVEEELVLEVHQEQVYKILVVGLLVSITAAAAVE